MTDTSTLSLVEAAAEEPVTVEQQKMDPSLQDYLQELEKRPFSRNNLRIDTHHPIAPQIAVRWPQVPGRGAQTQQCLQSIEEAVRLIPTIDLMPNIIMRISVGTEQMAPIPMPEAHESTVVAVFDSAEGIVRRCVVPPTDHSPALDHMSISAGMMIECQPLPGFYNQFTDKRPVGTGAPPDVYSSVPRNHDKRLKPNQLPEGPFIEPTPPTPSQQQMNPLGTPPTQQTHVIPQKESGPANALLVEEEMEEAGAEAAIEAGVVAAEEARRFEERRLEENKREENNKLQENRREENIREEQIKREEEQRREMTARNAEQAAEVEPEPATGPEAAASAESQAPEPESTLSKAEEIGLLASEIATAEAEVTAADPEMLDSAQAEPKRPEIAGEEAVAQTAEAAPEPQETGGVPETAEQAQGETAEENNALSPQNEFDGADAEPANAEPATDSQSEEQQPEQNEPAEQLDEIDRAQESLPDEQPEPEQSQQESPQNEDEEGQQESAEPEQQEENNPSDNAEQPQNENENQQQEQQPEQQQSEPEHAAHELHEAEDENGDERETESSDTQEQRREPEPEQDRSVEARNEPEPAHENDSGNAGEKSRELESEPEHSTENRGDRTREPENRQAESHEQTHSRGESAERKEELRGPEPENHGTKYEVLNQEQHNATSNPLPHSIHEAAIHHIVEHAVAHNADAAHAAGTAVRHTPLAAAPAPNLSGVNARPATRELALAGVSGAALAGSQAGQKAGSTARRTRPVKASPRAKTAPSADNALLKKKLRADKRKAYATKQAPAAQSIPASKLEHLTPDD